MRAGEAFPSQYLKKEDLGSARPTLTIDRVEIEQVGFGKDAKQAPVVYFVGKEKGMVLNKGNASVITALNGGDDEMDNWRGLKITLYVDPTVMFGGKAVGGIRVGMANGAAPRPAPPPRNTFDDATASGHAGDDPDDDLNF